MNQFKSYSEILILDQLKEVSLLQIIIIIWELKYIQNTLTNIRQNKFKIYFYYEGLLESIFYLARELNH